MPPPPLQALIRDVLATHRSVRRSAYLRLFPPAAAPTAPPPAHPSPAARLKPLRTALLKVQGPLPPPHLRNIAAGIACLHRLGVCSVVVLDHPSWGGARVRPDGTLTLPAPAERQESVRHQMAVQLARLAQALEENGMDARPVPHAFMRLAPPPPPRERDGPTGTVPLPLLPLVPDHDLRTLRTALERNKVPILPPLALHATAGATKTLAVPAADFLPALAREMVRDGAQSASRVDLTPVRVMLVNRFGRIPSERGEINLSPEYECVSRALQEAGDHAAEAELTVARHCLSVLPRESLAVTLSPRSPQHLLANLLTDKPSAAAAEVTVIRHGLPLRTVHRFEQVNWDRMQYLLEVSFGRTLDKDAYLTRLRDNLDFVVVLGEYEGVAIVTREWAPQESRTATPPIAYLDKFALLPALRGSGAADLLWSAVRRQLHAPQRDSYPSSATDRDLVWKSPGTSAVNQWYHEHSNGYLKLPPTPFGPSPSQERWCMFWCDAQDRLASLAEKREQGALRPAAPTSAEETEDPLGFSLSRRRMWLASRTAAVPWGREARPMHTLAAGETLPTALPLIAPGEEGRLARWSSALSSIPSCWLP